MTAPAEKLCPACGQTKPAAHFWRNKATRDGLQNQCKICLNAMNVEARRRKAARVPTPEQTGTVVASAAVTMLVSLYLLGLVASAVIEGRWPL